MDVLATILTFMQERRGESFIVATANDASKLPPELLRRFDETWWVDLPEYAERDEILKAALRVHGRDYDRLNDGGASADNLWDRLCEATATFTGSEIAGLVPDALYTAFADGEREIETRDLLAAAKTVVPLAKTAAEKIAKLREWAQGRARPATGDKIVVEAQAPRARTLDL